MKPGVVAAIAACEQRGGRITPLRRQVLAALWDSSRPLGAYELRDRLAAATQRRVPLPSVYRSLAFLCEHRVAVRIESLNAFLACRRPELDAPRVYFLCERCRQALEIDDGSLERRILEGAAEVGFEVDHRIIELTGVCRKCAGP